MWFFHDKTTDGTLKEQQEEIVATQRSSEDDEVDVLSSHREGEDNDEFTDEEEDLNVEYEEDSEDEYKEESIETNSDKDDSDKIDVDNEHENPSQEELSIPNGKSPESTETNSDALADSEQDRKQDILPPKSEFGAQQVQASSSTSNSSYSPQGDENNVTQSDNLTINSNKNQVPPLASSVTPLSMEVVDKCDAPPTELDAAGKEPHPAPFAVAENTCDKNNEAEDHLSSNTLPPAEPILEEPKVSTNEPNVPASDDSSQSIQPPVQAPHNDTLPTPKDELESKKSHDSLEKTKGTDDAHDLLTMVDSMLVDTLPPKLTTTTQAPATSSSAGSNVMLQSSNSMETTATAKTTNNANKDEFSTKDSQLLGTNTCSLQHKQEATTIACAENKNTGHDAPPSAIGEIKNDEHHGENVATPLPPLLSAKNQGPAIDAGDTSDEILDSLFLKKQETKVSASAANDEPSSTIETQSPSKGNFKDEDISAARQNQKSDDPLSSQQPNTDNDFSRKLSSSHNIAINNNDSTAALEFLGDVPCQQPQHQQECNNEPSSRAIAADNRSEAPEPSMEQEDAPIGVEKSPEVEERNNVQNDAPLTASQDGVKAPNVEHNAPKVDNENLQTTSNINHMRTIRFLLDEDKGSAQEDENITVNEKCTPSSTEEKSFPTSKLQIEPLKSVANNSGVTKATGGKPPLSPRPSSSSTKKMLKQKVSSDPKQNDNTTVDQMSKQVSVDKILESIDSCRAGPSNHKENVDSIASPSLSESPDLPKESILDTIEKIESEKRKREEKISNDEGEHESEQKPKNENEGGDELPQGVDETKGLGINEEGEVIAAEESQTTDAFLVSDEILAKTLSIYEELSEEDGLLLESFRTNEDLSNQDDTTGDDDDEKTYMTTATAATEAEQASVMHLKKNRKSVAREISHESQALFDILDRDFASVSPRVTVKIGGLSHQLVSEDVKLCFVAFVDCFSPPGKSHFATEFNYTVGDFGARESTAIKAGGDGDEGDAENDLGDEESQISVDTERFSRPFVPTKIVNALWMDVIRTKFLDRHDMTKNVARKIDNAREEVFAPALSFIRDTLILLGVLDIRKVNSKSNLQETEQILSMEETYFIDASRERTETIDEVVSVHQDIHQEYGEYLASKEPYQSVLEKHEKRWNSEICAQCSSDCKNRNEASYAVQMLPWNTIRANKFREAAMLLSDKKFLNGRLQALGVLEGTTAQVTDLEELLLQYFEMKHTILCFESIDPDQVMIDAYERTKKDICRMLRELDESERAGGVHLEGKFNRHLRKAQMETGKALHLMGVSLGAQGHAEKEMEFCHEALQMKKEAACGPSVSISDTLHCIGFALDSAGRYHEAMQFYDQALVIRRNLLGDENLRVAETLHNKGAILCENGECDEAMDCLEESLETRMLHHGENHESCADTQQWIGNVMRELGSLDEALQYFQTALKTKKSILGADHVEVANTLQNMAVVLDDMGNYQLSLDCYNEALRIYTIQHGEENVRVADTLHRVAIDYIIIEANESALATFNRAINIREKLLDPDHRGMCDQRLIVRSLIQREEVDKDEAISSFGDLIECYEEALVLTEKLRPDDNKALGRIKHRLGDLYWEIEDLDKSAESFQGALKSQRLLANTNQIDEAEVCDLLYKKGIVHLYRKEYHKAKSCFESVLYRRKKSKNSEPETEGTALYCLGMSFHCLDANKLSLVALTESLRVWKDEFGESDVRCGYALYWIGIQESKMKRFDQAITWYRGALRTFRSNKKEVDFAIVSKTLDLLGRAQERQENLMAALRCYAEGIRLLRWQLGEKHQSVIGMLCRSGNINKSLKLEKEALEFYEDAISVMRARGMAKDLQLCSTLEIVGLLHESTGNFDAARENLSEAYRLFEEAVGREDIRAAGTVQKLGRVLDALDSREAAMQCYRECLRVQRMKLSCDHKDLADTLFYMGTNLTKTEQKEDATKCFQQALSIQRSAYGDNSIIVSKTLFSLGKSYQETDYFDKACVCFKEALRIISSKDSSNTKMISEVSFCMAESHVANDNYQAAIAYFEQALEIWKNSENHEPRLALGLQKIGLVYLKIGDSGKAADFLGESLDLMERDEDQSSNLALLSATLSGLAKSFANIGAYDSAVAHYQRQIDLLRVDSAFDDNISDSFYAMGTIYARLNNCEDAIQHFKDCLILRRKTYGTSDGRVARVLVNMGVLFEKVGEFGPARDCSSEALRINKANANERDVSSNLQDLGRILSKQGNHEAALECFVEALQMIKRFHGSSDPQVGTLLHTCGITLFEKSDFKKALEFFREAMKIRKAKTGPDSKETAETVSMIGRCLAKIGSYEEAIEYLTQAIAVLKMAKGKESSDVGNCSEGLGHSFFSTGQYESAESHFRDAVAALEKSIGKDSFEVSNIFFKLAESCKEQQKFEDALDASVKALRGRKISIGSQSIECAESLRQIGDIQAALRHRHEALNCYIEALRIFSVVQGRGHVTVAECLEKIGSIYFEDNQFDEAEENLKRAMKIYTENVGGISIQVAHILLMLGKLEAKREKRDDALAFFKHCVQISKELKNNAVLSSSLYEIGLVLESKRKRGEAMECFKEALRLATTTECAITSAQAFSRIGGILAESDDFDDALKAYENAKNLFVKHKGEIAIEVGQVLHNIAGIHESCGNYDESKECFAQARDIFLEKLGPDDLSVALVLNNLAINYARRGDYARARQDCGEALRIRVKVLGHDHLETCDTLYNIAKIYDEEGLVNEAMNFGAKALESYRTALGDENLEVANCFQFIGALHLRRGEQELAERAFVEALRIHQIQRRETTGMATTMFNLGKLYVKRGDYSKATETLGQCLHIHKSLDVDDQFEIAATCGFLGAAYAGQNLVIEAKKFLERAMKIYSDSGKKNAPEYAMCLSQLAIVLANEEEKRHDALQMFQQALDIYKGTIGEVSDEVADIMIQIGIIHNKRVDYEEALKYFSSGLTIRTTLFGRDDMKVASTLFEIGKVMQEWGDSDEALDTFGEVLRIVKIHRGDSNATSAEALKRMGQVHLEKGDLDAAFGCLRQVIGLQEKLFGADSIEIGHTLLSVAAVHDARSQDDAALASYSDAVRIFKNRLGPDDVSVALALTKIGVNHARRRNYAKALTLCSEALRIRKLKLGNYHSDVADSCLNIATVLEEWGKEDQAMKFYKEALDLFRAKLGDDDVQVANCLHHVGGIHLKQNDNKRAIQCYVEAIRIYRLKKGNESLDLATTLFDLGRVYGKAADYDKALGSFQESLRIRRMQLGDAHLDVVAVERYIVAVARKRRY